MAGDSFWYMVIRKALLSGFESACAHLHVWGQISGFSQLTCLCAYLPIDLWCFLFSYPDVCSLICAVTATKIANFKDFFLYVVFSDSNFYKVCLGPTAGMHEHTHTHTHKHTQREIFSPYNWSIHLFSSWMKGCWPDVDFLKNSTIFTIERLLKFREKIVKN